MRDANQTLTGYFGGGVLRTFFWGGSLCHSTNVRTAGISENNLNMNLSSVFDWLVKGRTMYFPANTSYLLVLARHCVKGAIWASPFVTAAVMAASLNGSSSSSLTGITTSPKQMGSSYNHQ